MIHGGGGDDCLFGGDGNDQIHGGDDNDQLWVTQATTCSTAARAATWPITNMRCGAVTVDLSSGTASGADGNDTLVAIEDIHGSAFDDQLTGDGGDNFISAGDGNDVVVAGGGEDYVLGGLGE